MATLEGSVQNTNRLSLEQQLTIHRIVREDRSLKVHCSTNGFGISLALSVFEAAQLSEGLRSMLAQPSIQVILIQPDLTKERGPD